MCPSEPLSAVLQYCMFWVRTAEMDSKHDQKGKTLAVVLCEDTRDRLVLQEVEKAEMSAKTSAWCFTVIRDISFFCSYL